jgi:hypothetical protein
MDREKQNIKEVLDSIDSNKNIEFNLSNLNIELDKLNENEDRDALLESINEFKLLTKRGLQLSTRVNL